MKVLELVCDTVEDGLGDTIAEVVVYSLGSHVSVLFAAVVVEVDTLSTLDRKGGISHGVSGTPSVNHMFLCALFDFFKSPCL